MLKGKKKKADEIADTVIIPIGDKIIEKSKSEDMKDLDYGIIGVAGVISSIVNTINNISKKKGNKSDENKLIDFIKDLVSIDFSSKINEYLKIIDKWITDTVSKLIPLITTISISTLFDAIEKVISKLKESETKKMFDGFLIICIEYFKRNIPRLTQFLAFIICESFKSILKLPIIYLGKFFPNNDNF